MTEPGQQCIHHPGWCNNNNNTWNDNHHIVLYCQQLYCYIVIYCYIVNSAYTNLHGAITITIPGMTMIILLYCLPWLTYRYFANLSAFRNFFTNFENFWNSNVWSISAEYPSLSPSVHYLKNIYCLCSFFCFTGDLNFDQFELPFCHNITIYIDDNILSSATISALNFKF